jgi:hypothetical protein
MNLKPRTARGCACGLGSVMFLTGLAGHASGQPQLGPLSPSCERIRVQAIAAYWEATVTAEQAARMIKAMGSGSAEIKGRALVGEALDGRITVQQLGASTLAGTDAVNSSALCGEMDRQIAKNYRLMLPRLMIALAHQISAERMLKQ